MKLLNYQETMRDLAQRTHISLGICILRVQHDFQSQLLERAPVLARFAKDDLVETLLVKQALSVAADPEYQKMAQSGREVVMRIMLSRFMGEYLEKLIKSQAEAVALIECLEHCTKTYAL